jgi:tetratricopeptide (TPR) repeat protein
VLIVAFYGVRAITGLVGGIAFPIARTLADEGEYEKALPLLERATIGFNKAESLWWRSHLRVGLWRRIAGKKLPAAETEAVLRRASQEYLEAVATTPAAAWPWAGLAEIYDLADRGEPAARPGTLGDGIPRPWSSVRRPGRIAMGLLREAIRRNPNDYTYRDHLALMLLREGLMEEALEAVRASARAQPAFHFHSYRHFPSFPRELLVGFAEASRDALGKTPMLTRHKHLVFLGELEHRLGRYEQAEADFEAALQGAHALGRAEVHYWLGHVFMARKRFDDAAREFRLVADHPSFRRGALAALSRIAQQRGDQEEALRLLTELRRLEPREIGHCLSAALVARRLENWSAAKEALKWAILIEPRDRRPRVELVKTCLEQGDLNGAVFSLRELERQLGAEHAEVRELRALIEQRSGN